MGHIFISYSHKDMDYAYRLTETLQASGFQVWIDTRLDYGSQWPREIQKRLDSCDAFILIMTPRSFDSDWVQSELQRAKRKGRPIFPLLLEGDETWLSVESTQFYDVRGGKFPDARFFSALKQAVAVGSQDRTLQSWKPSLQRSSGRLRTALASALGIVAIVTIGLLGSCSPVASAQGTASPAVVATSTIPVQAPVVDEPTQQVQQSVPTSEMDLTETLTVEALEPRLNEANVVISTGSEQDLERVRGYFTGPDSAYHMLAVASLQVVGDRQFRQTAYLDMIEKWYTIVVGEDNYLTSEGQLHLDKVPDAMVKAHNEYYGDDAQSLEEILVPALSG
jgi:hypothetical protein